MVKELIEKRNALVDELEAMINTVKAEIRSFNDTENTRIAEIKAEIAGIDSTLKTIEESRSLEKKESTKVDTDVETRALEEKAFLEFVRGETRALSTGDNGAVIPTTIANKIIEKVYELSPIYQLADVINVKGKLVFPVEDVSSTNVNAAYIDEFTELTEGTMKFTTVELDGYVAGVLAKISKSLINKTEFDLVGYIVKKVAERIAQFLEKEMIVGTTNKMTGVLSATQTVTGATVAKVDADDIIDLMDLVKEVYQEKAVFIMHKSTRKVLRKLKDNENRYLLEKDVTAPFGFTLFGKPVYISENMPTIATGNKAVVYGDMTGLTVKLDKDVEIQTLVEKYATQHAIGVCGFIQADSKITDQQKLAVLIVK